jgi:hypothetical protein
MKRLLIIILAAIFSLPSFGQQSTDTKWTLSMDFGLQKHDKRLFGFPPFPAAHLLESQPESYGTYQFGISAVRKILHKGRFEIFAGGGLSSELSTFTRPFDLDFGKKFKRNILIMTNRYYQYLLQLPVETRFRFDKNFGLSLELLPQFNFLAIADYAKRDKSYSWWMFDFYSVEINPGLSYDKGRVEFGLKYRAFQVKKIDRILFNSLINDPRTDQVFETYNPFKLWFSVGYKF